MLEGTGGWVLILLEGDIERREGYGRKTFKKLVVSPGQKEPGVFLSTERKPCDWSLMNNKECGRYQKRTHHNTNVPHTKDTQMGRGTWDSNPCRHSMKTVSRAVPQVTAWRGGA